MGGAGRDADQPADLLEREAAPEMGDDDFAFLDRQRFQGGGRGFAVERGVFLRGEPCGPAGGDFGLMAPPSAFGAGRARAPLRTTRKSHAAGWFGDGCWAASLTNASCTTSSAAAHH